MKIYRLRRIGRYVGVPEVPDILNELYFRSRQGAEDMQGFFRQEYDISESDADVRWLPLDEINVLE